MFEGVAKVVLEGDEEVAGPAIKGFHVVMIVRNYYLNDYRLNRSEEYIR